MSTIQGPGSASNPSLGSSTRTAELARDSAGERLEIDRTRVRQTERPQSQFRGVLTDGVSLLMSGAEVATHVVGGPVLAAAVHDARTSAVAAVGGGATAGLATAGGPAAGAAVAATAATGGAAPATDLQSMLQGGQASNLQLLALQEQIQQESQQFSTVSNVMRAKYDTAKSAVQNIRA
jgi:hypothetical protein